MKKQTITPAQAKKWLASKNKDNRGLRMGMVNAYARDIESGNWKFTGDAIRFNGDGTLIDGQHRLAAVVKSGKAIQSVVMRGLESESKFVFDTGAKRSLSDVLHYKGYMYNALLAAAIRWCAQYERGALASYESGFNLVSTSEALAWLEKNKRIAANAKIVGSSGIPYGSVKSPLIAILHWDKTAEAMGFFESLRDGENLRKGHPIYSLREMLAQEYARDKRTKTTRVMQAWTIKAWNAYVQGERATSSMLRFIPGGMNAEEFPVIITKR